VTSTGGEGEGDPAGSEQSTRPTRLAISDVHGHLDALRVSLQEHGVTDEQHRWTAGTARLWFLGDYLDRGRQGLEVVDLVRALQRDAAPSGGFVKPLLGNHELQFLAALHFGDRHVAGDGRTPWREGWLRYGGVEEELHDVEDATVEWLTRLPLMDLDGDDVLLHSDTDAYLRLGRTVDDINGAGREILASRDTDAWALLHGILTQRDGFRGRGSPGRLLSELGARRVVHGHSPLMGSMGLPAEEARAPHVYASGRAVAIDGGVFEGGSLLVAHL
jgi:hypothetical protein